MSSRTLHFVAWDRLLPTRYYQPWKTSVMNIWHISVTINVLAGKCKALLSYRIDPQLCVGCTLCSRNCPVDAIIGERKEVHFIDTAKCIKCGTCKDKCKFNGISAQDNGNDEIQNEKRKSYGTTYNSAN